MNAIVTDQFTALACQTLVDETFGFPTEGVDVGSGKHVPPGSPERFTTTFVEPMQHPTKKDEWAYPYLDGNSSRLDAIKADAIAAGVSGNAEQKLIAIAPEASELDNTWFEASK